MNKDCHHGRDRSRGSGTADQPCLRSRVPETGANGEAFARRPSPRATSGAGGPAGSPGPRTSHHARFDLGAAPTGLVRPADVDLGTTELGETIGLDLARLLDGRMLVQGASGAGKSWTLRRLIEQTAGRVQQIIVDPEGEFRSISEAYGHFHVEAHKLDIAALAVLAARVRAHRISVLLDMSELDREGQLQAIAAFFEALVNAPRAHWHACLVFVDEAHLFAPFGGQSSAATSVRRSAIGAVVDLMSRGRKRGLAGVLATQRLARLAKSVASEMHNFLVGMNTLDLDIRRAAETIGWDASKAFDRLPMLEPGDFVAVGPAFSRSPVVLRVGGVVTHHRGADLNSLMDATVVDDTLRDENALLPGLKAVRAFIRDPAFPVAGRLLAELRTLQPDRASIADIAPGLSISPTEAAAAITLLDQFGALEFMGDGDGRAIRIEKGMHQ
nr:DUF87 domain-containing protein [Mesorhizobium sp.]